MATAKGQPGDLLTNAIKANVRLTVERIKEAEPIVAPLVVGGKVQVVGGFYDLATGEVELLS